MSCGARRPDWGRHGAPSEREIAEMLYWRQRVLAGIPSLATADLVCRSQMGAEAPPAAPKPEPSAPQIAALFGVSMPPEPPPVRRHG